MRQKDRRIVNIAILLAISILLSSSAFAIGVSPSKNVVPFKPGQKVSYTLDIVNNGHEMLDVLVYPRGEFEKDIKLSTQSFRMGAKEETKRINIEFTMPGSIEKAGEHTVDIVAVGSTQTPEESEAIVKADLAVISKLIIDVPYPDKYAEARMYALDTELGKKTSFSIPVFNKGSKDIEQLYATVEVSNSDGTKIDEITTEKTSLKKGDNTKLIAQATKEYPNGEYHAVATVHYDEKQTRAETMFSVGELELQIKALVVDGFVLGQVARFDIMLQNSWSTDLKGVYAEMEITDQDNNRMTEFKTVATDIPAKQFGRLEGYWYTEGVMPGIYTAKVTLYYANKITEKMFELEVQPNRILTRELVAGRAVSAQEEVNIQNNSYLILIILVLVAVIAVLFIKTRGRGQKPANALVHTAQATPTAAATQEPAAQASQTVQTASATSPATQSQQPDAVEGKKT
jgi:hypothetical protein